MSLPSLLGPVVKPASGGKAKQLIVFLHGVGADGQDLIGLADEFADAFPDAQFVSPNAPFPCDMAPYGYQWFSLLDRSHDAMLEGVQQAAPIVNQFLDHQLNALSLSDSNLAVIGFSQGTMTSLYTLPRRAKPCAAVVGFSGAMIGAEYLGDEITARPPICLIHGQMDEVVPFGAMELAARALLENGVPCKAYAVPNLGHGISPSGIEMAIEFLKTHLA